MAHARLSPLLGAVSGSISSCTFNRRGPAIILAKRRSRASPPTLRQLNTQLEFSRRQALWLALSSAYHDKWTTYASMHTRLDPLGQARTLSAKMWFFWWVPWAEAGTSEGLSPDYAPPAHSILTEPLDPIGLDFTADGALNVDVTCNIYPAYKQFLRISIAAQNVTPYSFPRIWRHCGFLLFDATTIDIALPVAAQDITLQPDQAVTVRLATIMKGTPNYWPSIYSTASTIVHS